MNWEIIIHIASVVVGALATGIPTFIKWNNARKATKTAVTETGRKQAQLEMVEQANILIAEAETAFKSVDEIMKARNSGSAGQLKKKSVISDLQAYALSKGYEFNSEFWSAKIDEIVAFTKSVNSKK